MQIPGIPNSKFHFIGYHLGVIFGNVEKGLKRSVQQVLPKKNEK